MESLSSVAVLPNGITMPIMDAAYIAQLEGGDGVSDRVARLKKEAANITCVHNCLLFIKNGVLALGTYQYPTDH
jgi:hypothetical protein